MEFQCLRKNGRILGKTVFDDGWEAVYDLDRREYTLFPVKAGTILIDVSLCAEDAKTGRLRFTCAHELAHWILHKKLYTGTGESAAMAPAVQEDDMEIQANILGSALLMPMPQVKRCFYQLRAGRGAQALVAVMASCSRSPGRLCASDWKTTICCKNFCCYVLKNENDDKNTERYR